MRVIRPANGWDLQDPLQSSGKRRGSPSHRSAKPRPVTPGTAPQRTRKESVSGPSRNRKGSHIARSASLASATCPLSFSCGIGAEQVKAVIAAHTGGRALGFMGEPSVNVLAVNLELDHLAR